MTANNTGGRPDGNPRVNTSSPVRADHIEAIDRQKNDLRTIGDDQLGPDDDQSGRANLPRTENARQAELAAGREPDDDNRPDAERAFRESRGDNREHEGRVQ